MDLPLVEHVEVWAATIQDRAGGLAEVLAALREAGADLQFIIARRAPENPGTGVVFVTPLQGDREIRAAADVGFNVTKNLHAVRIIGPDRPGVAAEITQKLAGGGVNLRGFSASVIGIQFVAYVAVDSVDDADKALAILEKA
jgi:predicted amino acid-binding ACT domain protein